MFRIQDTVAAEIARAHAQLASAAVRVKEAEAGVAEAQISFAGNLKGLSETTHSEVLVLVNRPQEVVAALQQMANGLRQLLHCDQRVQPGPVPPLQAFGFPADILADKQSPGTIQPIDTHRPSMMAPVVVPGHP